MLRTRRSLLGAALLCCVGLTDILPQSLPFRRGDANDSGTIDISDASFALGCLFSDTACPPCADAADANDDGAFNIADPVYTLNWLFGGGPAPRVPGDSCGLDPTEDALTCSSFQTCASDLALERIEIHPRSLLLTGAGEQASLTAVYYNSNGNAVAADFAWTSSRPSAVSVGEDGRITARQNVGSAQITVTANGIDSPPAPVIVAQPAEGAEMIMDDDVLEGPELVNPEAPLDVGMRYRVVLKDAVRASPGTVLVPAEGAPIAGRVVDRRAVAGGNEVTLEVLPLTEVFRTLSINERIDLQLAESLLTEEAERARKIAERPDGFEMQFGQADLRGVGGAGDGFTFGLGPFECKAELMPQLNGSLIKLDVTQQLFMDFQVEIEDGELKRLLVKLDGDVTGSIQAGLFLTASFNGSIKCKATLKEIAVPVPAPVAVIFGPVVPIGLGLNIEGKLELSLIELGVAGEASAALQLGFDYQADSGFVGFDQFEPSADFDFIHEVPEDLIDSLRLKASVYPHAFAELASKGIVGAALGEVADGGKSFGLVAVTAGTQLAANLATTEGQANDPESASDYELKLLAKAGLAGDLKKLFQLFGGVNVTLIDVSVNHEVGLAGSPQGKLSVDNANPRVNDEVTFTVDLDASSVDFPVIGYNVDRIEIFRIRENGLEPAQTLAASLGQTQFNWTWTPRNSDVGSNTFVAFVTTHGIPRVPLELANDTRLAITVRPKRFAEYAAETRTDPNTVVGGRLPGINCQDHADVNIVDESGTRRGVIDGSEAGFVATLFTEDLQADTISTQVETIGRSLVFVEEPGARVELEVRTDFGVAGGVVGPNGTIDFQVGVYEISDPVQLRWKLMGYVNIVSGSTGISSTVDECPRPAVRGRGCDSRSIDGWPGSARWTCTLPEAGIAELFFFAWSLSDAFDGKRVTANAEVTLRPAPGSEDKIIFATPVEPGICRPLDEDEEAE